MGKRVVITKAGGVSAITTQPMEAPAPGEGEVRIKVAYAGINFADLLMRMGFYQPRPLAELQGSGSHAACATVNEHFVIWT